MERLLHKLSFGRSLSQATALYLLLGSLMLIFAPDPPSALAQGSGGGCGPGMKDCNGTCIEDYYVCCEDGTYAPGDTCTCCTGCDSSECIDESTVVCEEDVDDYFENQSEHSAE